MLVNTTTKGAQVRNTIVETPWMTRKEIATAVGCTVARVGEIVRQMDAAGTVEEKAALVRLADHQRLVTASRAHDVIAC